MTQARAVDEAAVRAALAEVPDPEIPAISVVDLGIVSSVRVTDQAIEVDLLPTFVGCPALDAIRDAVTDRLAEFERPTDVRYTYATPWTTDRITETGRRHLDASGFAPPAVGPDAHLIALDAPVPCPYCGSRRTRLENAFGPTRCRSIRYCSACRQPFESFKVV